MPTNKPGRAAGRAPSSTATARPRHGPGAAPTRLVVPNRWPAASRGSSTDRSSPTRPSTASSMRRWPAKQSTPGATRRKSQTRAPWLQGAQPGVFIALRRPLAERPAAVADRRTPGHSDLMLFRIYPTILTLHERHSRLLKSLAHAIATLLAPLPPTWRQTIDLRGITPSIRSASKPSSVRPTRPGKRAASRTPSAVCAAPCRARPTWRPSRRALYAPHTGILIRLDASYQTPAEVFRNHLLHFKWNPHSRVRGNDRYGYSAEMNKRYNVPVTDFS